MDESRVERRMRRMFGVRAARLGADRTLLELGRLCDGLQVRRKELYAERDKLAMAKASLDGRVAAFNRMDEMYRYGEGTKEYFDILRETNIMNMKIRANNSAMDDTFNQYNAAALAYNDRERQAARRAVDERQHDLELTPLLLGDNPLKRLWRSAFGEKGFDRSRRLAEVEYVAAFYDERMARAMGGRELSPYLARVRSTASLCRSALQWAERGGPPGFSNARS